MNEKGEQSNELYNKTELFPGAFTILGPSGNILKNAGVKYPFPLPEELTDILIDELSYIFDDEEEMPLDDIFSGSLEYTELVSAVDISAFEVVSELMKAKSDNDHYVRHTWLDIDNALSYDTLLTIDREDTFALNSEYKNKAKEYFGRYNVKLPFIMNRSNHDDMHDDKFLFGLFLYEKIRELSRPEMIALVHLFKKLKGFSIILPFLWVKDVIDETDLAVAYIDSLYKLNYVIDVDLKKFSLNEIDTMEAVLMDKLCFLRQAIDIYIYDAVKMFPN
jgi:hypothetical protein